MTPKIQSLRGKTDKLDLIKFKTFALQKPLLRGIKGQATRSEKIFANDTSDNGLVSRIYKDLET